MTAGSNEDIAPRHVHPMWTVRTAAKGVWLQAMPEAELQRACGSLRIRSRALSMELLRRARAFACRLVSPARQLSLFAVVNTICKRIIT
jgi:hypothetical protein